MERRHIGEHTFDPKNTNLNNKKEEMKNRDRLIDLCYKNDIFSRNTKYAKQENQKCTFREVGTTKEQRARRGTHEQIDFILTNNRWNKHVYKR